MICFEGKEKHLDGSILQSRCLFLIDFNFIFLCMIGSNYKIIAPKIPDIILITTIEQNM